MPIDEKSLEEFSELELIAYCLDEITFIGFEQEDIQAEMDKLKKISDEYSKLTPEEKAKRTYTIDEVKDMISDNEENSEEGKEDKDEEGRLLDN